MQNSKVYSSILQTQKEFTQRLRKEKGINQEVANKQRETKILETLKHVAENSDDIQNNHTPLEICNMMLEKVDLKKAKSILVLYNVELLFALRKAKYQGQVTFFTQSIDKKIWAEKLLPGVVVEYIDKEENPLYFMENQWPDKFDVVIANPPYGSGTKKLDIKFLDKSIDICDGEVVFVHPSSQYVDGKGQNKLYNQINEKIKPFLSSLHFFNGNGIFNINLFVPCSITHLDKKNKSSTFNFSSVIHNQSVDVDKNELSNISLFGYSEDFISIKKKITSTLKNNGSLKDISTVLGFSGDQSHKMVLKNPEAFFVEMTHITGGQMRSWQSSINSTMHKADFFILLSKYQFVVKRGQNPKYRIWFEFNTLSEAENFLSYIKTDFVRMCLAFTKTNQNIAQNELGNIPLVDFSQKWDDEILFEKFGLSESQISFIKSNIPNWYD